MNAYNCQSSPVQSSPVQSVIIPTYNRKEFLADAINSVLSQTQKSLEVIVVDDCSTDGTGDFVKSLTDKRVHYFRNDKNSGQELSRMNGFRQARGKYITFLDDDDYYTDYDFFAKAVRLHEEHEAAGDPLVMVYANAKILDMQRNIGIVGDIGSSGRVKGLDFVLRRKGYAKPPSTFPTVFRAETLRRAGLYDNIIFDTETYCQAALLGDAWLMNGVIGMYRLHKQSSTLGYNNHPVQNKRIDAKIKAMAERGVIIAEGICALTNKKEADEWCIHDAKVLLYCYRGQQKYINELRTYGKAMLIMSKFTSKVLMMSPFWEIRRLIMSPFWKIRRLLSKITPLRKLYRFVKYRLSGKPYPEF